MGKRHLKCVICKKSSDKIIVLNDEKLQKCKNFLKIRKDNNLKFSDLILPENVTQIDGYHSQCYRHFSALMKHHVEKSRSIPCQPSKSSTGDSLITRNAEEPITVDEISSAPVNIENMEICEENLDIPASLENLEQLRNEDVIVTNTNVCFFCTKSAKKWKGQIQKLCDLDTASLKRAIEPFRSFVSDTEVFNKLQQAQESTILKAHRVCRKDYINSLRLFVDKPQTSFHKNLEFHKEGFENICQFIDDNIIVNKECYTFTFLCDFYEASIKNAASEDGDIYDNILSKANFESKLKKHYEGQLKFSIFHNKKIVGPIDREIDENIYSLLEEKSILHNAALILRGKILDIDQKTLPEKITTSDLLKGECNIPQTLKDFYLTVLTGCHSRRRKSIENYRVSNSLAADLIHNVSKGKIKTSDLRRIKSATI